MRTALFVSFYYPPSSHTGGRRPHGLAKYLADFGWQVVVLTREFGTVAHDDEPGIVRVPLGKSLLSRASRIVSKPHTLLFPHHAPHDWRRMAQKKLDDISAKHKIDAVWATCPPDITLHLAQRFSAAKSIPWIADYRDIWDQPYMGSRALLPIRLFHEKRLLKSASSIVTVSQALAETLKARHRRNVEVIPNGYDPDDSAGTRCNPITEKFVIRYTGSLILPYQKPRSILDAIGHAIECGEMDENDIRLEFVGSNRSSVMDAVGDHRWQHLVEIVPAVPFDESYRLQRASTVLLLLTIAGERGILTSKLFDYLAAGRPILAFPDDRDCISKVMKHTRAGVCADNVDSVRHQLVQWYREWKKTGTVLYHGDAEAIDSYSRRAQAGQLAKLLDLAVDAGHKKPVGTC